MGLLTQVRNVASGMSPAELRKLSEWAKNQEQEAKVDPLGHGFLPHKAQMEVHTSTSQDILFVAANRIGKSTTGIREALWRATGTHPYKKVRPHSTIWCGFPDYPFYRRTTFPIYRRWFPRNRLLEFDKSEKIAVFRREDGGTCEVFFVSYDSGRDKWQGAAVDFIWLDEECPQDIYEEAMARLADSGGDMLMTQTPVSGLGWTYDSIFLPWQKGQGDWEVVEGALAEYRPECECGHNPEQHNRGHECEEEGCGCQEFKEAFELSVGAPLLPPGHPMSDRKKILRFARSIKDPDQRMIRIFGKYRARAGGIYKQFSADTNVIPAFKIPPYWEIWGGIDPGFHGFAVTLLAQDPFGRVYAFYEYFSQGETGGARARELWASITKLVDVPEDDYIVLYVDTEDPQTVLELNTWAQENGARLAFASLNQGSKAIKAGIGRVQEYLAPSRDRHTPISVLRQKPEEGEPLLYFFDTLKSSWLSGEDAHEESRLVWEIVRYRWKRKKGENVQTDEPDKASAGGAHMLDALRYAMMARLGPPPEPSVNERRPGESAIDREVREHRDELHERLMAAKKAGMQ